MSDFRLNVIAETQAAERKLQQVDKLADTAVKPRKLSIDVSTVNKSFSDLKTNIEGAANNIAQFYKVSRNIPGVGSGIRATENTVKNLAKSTADLATAAPGATAGLVKASSAGSILSNSLKSVVSNTNSVITQFARLGLSIYAIKESTNILKAAFGGLFTETVGRAARFQETLLKTQTTLASTNKVFKGDKEITDPLEKVLALQGAIEERVKSIRDRSIDLAGVTSNEVVEVFGIVASQIGQVGGGLKEAEDLAINFAAALGTFGIPLYQARQEVGSILRGDITVDSYLARALGITNPDIARAKTEAGGVIKFLEEKLAGAVAGQTIAAKGLAGVLSNIRDIAEIVTQAIGEPLLDPIIAASTALYNVLFSAKDTLADIGTSIGKIFSDIGKRFTSAFQLGDAGEISLLNVFTKQAPVVFATIKQDLTGINSLVGETLTRLGSAFRELFTSLTAMSATTVKAFRELLDAFIQLQLVSFESLISAIATLAQGLTPVVVALTKVLEGWADILRLPIVQFFAQIGITFAVLQKTGVLAIAAIITQLAIWAVSWQAIVQKVQVGGAFIQGVIKSISVSLGSLLLLLGQASTALKTLFISQGADPKIIKNITDLELQLNKAGRNAKGLAYNFRNLGAAVNTLGRSLGALVLNVIKANVAIIAVTVGITLLVDAYGRWKRAQEEARQALRDNQVINKYVATVQYLNRELTVSEQKLKDAALAAADKKYEEATVRITELREELEKLRKELDKDKAGRERPASQRKIRVNQREDIAFETYGERRRRRRLTELELELMAKRKEQADALATLEEEKAKDAVRTATQNRTNLEKEIGELRRQIDNDLFQQRQALAQQEVEIFRLAGELRIKQIERANEKLLEGEEGASRAALEALNNYIATRERDELEIESAKKTLAIEVANLEKSISDYRLDIEKKIAEIRKKSADYEQRAAGGKTPAAPGVTAGFRVGSTGRSTGPHLDIRSPTGNKQAVIDEATAIIKAWQGQGLEYIELSNAKIDVKNMFDEAQLREALVKEQTAHGSRAGGGAIDIAVPAGTLVPTPTGTPSWAGAGGWQATSLQTGNLFLHGLGASVASPTGAAAAAPAAPTTAGSDIPDAKKAADNYAAAVRNLAGAMERVRELQAAITKANTAAAFDRIAQAFFPRAQLEQYEDRLNEVRFTYDAVAASSADAFNPERSAIEVARLVQITGAARELEQVQKGIADKVKAGQLNEIERAKALDAVNTRYKQHLRDIERETAFKQRILVTEQATALITQMRNQARDIHADIEALRVRNRLQAEGVAPEFIAAEIAKLDIQRQVKQLTTELNTQLATEIELRDQLQQKIASTSGTEKAELEKQLAEALATIESLRKQLGGAESAGGALAAAEDARAQAATEPGARIRNFIGDAQRQLQDLEGMAIRVSQGIGDAVGNSLSNGITGLIEGTTTAKEVFATFLKDVGRILLQEGARMIATYIAIGIAKIFAGLSSPFSGDASIQGGGFGSFSGGSFGTDTSGAIGGQVGANLTARPFATGGFVAGPTRALIGEGGEPEYVIPQSKMTAAMSRYSRGARGESVIPGNGTSDAESGAAVATSQPIDVRYSVERINNVDYVTADQFQRGMQQAAQQGATQGERRALATLRQNTSQRKRIGI